MELVVFLYFREFHIDCIHITRILSRPNRSLFEIDFINTGVQIRFFHAGLDIQREVHVEPTTNQQLKEVIELLG